MDARTDTGAIRPGHARLNKLRLRTKTPFAIVAVLVLFILAVRVCVKTFLPPLIINYTHSEPYGLYSVIPHGLAEYRRGMLVLLPVPEGFTAMVYGRGWVNAGHPLMKGIGALAGDIVCVFADHAEINHRSIGPVFSRDSAGRELPRLRGCFVIQRGEFFPLSTYSDKSFDGRYIGPQPLASIVGELRPLWTF